MIVCSLALNNEIHLFLVLAWNETERACLVLFDSMQYIHSWILDMDNLPIYVQLES